MTNLPMTHFNTKEASASDIQALASFINLAWQEENPDEIPLSLEERITTIHEIPDFVRLLVAAIWNPDQTTILGAALIYLLDADTNKHLAQIQLHVLPEYRQRGLARRILKAMEHTLIENNRTLILVTTTEQIPAGHLVAERVGATKGQEHHANQLEIGTVDEALLERWLAVPEATQAAFELGFWDGPYPEDQLASIARLHDVMNEQPLDNLEIEDIHFTPEQIREMDEKHFNSGRKRWTLYLKERQSGNFVGFTEINWRPSRPHLISQLATGIFTEYRGKNLGRWLKAAMIQRIRDTLPDARIIRTHNADSNAAMLKINTELGFQPHQAEVVWQLQTSQLSAYLAATAVEA